MQYRLPWRLSGNESACQSRSPALGWEDPLEEEMGTVSSVLAWRMPWTEAPGGLQPMRSQGVRHSLATRKQQIVLLTILTRYVFHLDLWPIAVAYHHWRKMTSIEMLTPCMCLTEFIWLTLNVISFSFQLGRGSVRGNYYVDDGCRFVGFMINTACSHMLIDSGLCCKLNSRWFPLVHCCSTDKRFLK